MNKIFETLQNLGYNPVLSNNYYRCAAIYRDGNNKTALSIHKDTGRFRDFVSGDQGSWQDFLRLALNDNEELINQYTNGIYEFKPEVSQPKITQVKKYDPEVLNRLIPFPDFYLERGISQNTIDKFGIALATSGQLYNRLVTPLYDTQKNLIGFAGRQIKENPDYPKWILKGQKNSFVFPLHLEDVRQAIKNSGAVILVESVGDCLSLYNSDVKNIACTFGLSLSKSLITSFISLNVKNVIIALNNDSDNHNVNWGSEASSRIKSVASKFFDNVTELAIPNGKNDFGDCTRDEIREYFKL